MEQSHKQSEALRAAQAVRLADLVEVADGAVVSRVLARSAVGNLTLFAFDAGQSLSEHSAPFDAIVQVIEGDVELTIGGEKVQASAGHIVRMPAQVPHALTALGRMKMLLIMFRDAKQEG